MKSKHEEIDGVGYLTFKVTEEMGIMKLKEHDKERMLGLGTEVWKAQHYDQA